jgi:hypothetical protein
MSFNIIKIIKYAFGERKRFTDRMSKQLNDPVADITSWHPTNNSGTEYQTYELKEESENSFRFAPTTDSINRHTLFLNLSLGIIIVGFFVRKEYIIGSYILWLIGCVIFLKQSISFYYRTRPITFDFKKGDFWIGRTNSEIKTSTSCRLEQIYAIQIISQSFNKADRESHNQRFRSYELNLVFKDGSRINVLDHGKQKELIRDAKKIAKRLQIPWWNGT